MIKPELVVMQDNRAGGTGNGDMSFTDRVPVRRGWLYRTFVFWEESPSQQYDRETEEGRKAAGASE